MLCKVLLRLFNYRRRKVLGNHKPTMTGSQPKHVRGIGALQRVIGVVKDEYCFVIIEHLIGESRGDMTIVNSCDDMNGR